MTNATAFTRRLPGILLAFLALAAGIVSIAGGPVVPLWAVAIAAGFLTFAPHVGTASALAYSVLGFFAGELGLLMLGPALSLELPTVDLAAWLALSLMAAGFAIARPREARRLTPRRLWLGLAAGTGSLVLLTAFSIVGVLPGSGLAWGMSGDIPNVVVIARGMVTDGGISLSAGSQSTPLPFAMIAANMAGGRPALTGGLLLEHDVARLQQVWLFAIALGCVVSGAIAARFVDGMRLRFAMPVIAAVSSLSLTWYVIGVQFQHGFVSTAVALVLLLAAWLAYLGGDERPGSALVALFLAAIAILATWSPLVVCVVALGVALVVLRAAKLRRVKVGWLLLGALAPLAFVAYSLLVVLPLFASQSGFLGFDGGFPQIGPASVVVITAVASLAASVAARFAGMRFAATGALAVALSLGAGLVYLLLQRTDAATSWGYYPAKFAWMISILLLVVAAGFAVALLAAHPPRTRWDALIVAAGVLLFGAMLWAPGDALRPSAQLPLIGVLQGPAPGTTNAAELVFEFAGDDDARHVMWRSAAGDVAVNYWLLQVDAQHGMDDPVRHYAYLTTTFTIDQMCLVIQLLGSNVIVHTADPQASADLASACPNDGTYRVLLEDAGPAQSPVGPRG